MGERLAAAAIYDAVADDEAFEALPGALARAYGARSCNLIWFHADGGGQIMAHSRYYKDEHLETYTRHFADKDLWALRALTPQRVNRALDAGEFVPETEYRSSAFYNDWIRAMGDDAFYCIGAMIRTSWGVGLVGLHKGAGRRGFNGRSLQALSADMVHIRRTLAVRGRIAAGERRRLEVNGLFDAVDRAALSLDAARVCGVVNAAAERLLRGSTLLRLRGGRLEGVSPADDARLASAVALAARPDEPSAQTLVLEGPGERLRLTLLPLADPTGRRRVVCALDPERSDRTLAERLRRRFGLTPAEAEVAVMMARGLDSAAIAEARAVGRGTTRNQIKSLMSKLDCRRQAEAVTVVLSLGD